MKEISTSAYFAKVDTGFAIGIRANDWLGHLLAANRISLGRKMLQVRTIIGLDKVIEAAHRGSVSHETTNALVEIVQM